jgi:hypothetical protein
MRIVPNSSGGNMSFEEIVNSRELILGISVLGLMLMVFMLLLLREQKRAYYLAMFSHRQETAQLTQRHADIEGTLQFLDAIQEKPELMDKVGEYARQAMAASLLQRLAILSESIAKMEKRIQQALSNGYYSSADIYRREVKQLQQEQIALTRLADSFGTSHSMV